MTPVRLFSLLSLSLFSLLSLLSFLSLKVKSRNQNKPNNHVASLSFPPDKADKQQKTNTVNPRIIAKMDFSKMSHDGEIHDTYALLKALPHAATDADAQAAFSAATKKIRNRVRAVIVAYEDRIPSEVNEEEDDDDEGDDDDEDEDEENGEDEEEGETEAETDTNKNL
jgi:cobalamin biosynthesis protein CobT